MTSCVDLDWEDLGVVHPDDNADHGEEEGKDEVHGDRCA